MGVVEPWTEQKEECVDKLIINLACTGMVPTKVDNPYVPVTPDEIAHDCRCCYQAGASVLHLHARQKDGVPTYRPDIYEEIICKVRGCCPEAIICVSTSGRKFPRFEDRSAVLDLEGQAKPDMASLTLGSLNFPKQASVNEPAMIRRLAEKMRDRGIIPELEVFDIGMVDYATYLIRKGFLREPLYFNLLLGSLGTLSATPFNLATLVRSLPGSATWSATGIGRFQFAMNSLGIVMGGHVRVGLEDNLFFDSKKKQPATNLGLVERLANLAAAVGRAVATPQEARAMIGV